MKLFTKGLCVLLIMMSFTLGSYATHQTEIPQKAPPDFTLSNLVIVEFQKNIAAVCQIQLQADPIMVINAQTFYADNSPGIIASYKELYINIQQTAGKFRLCDRQAKDNIWPPGSDQISYSYDANKNACFRCTQLRT